MEWFVAGSAVLSVALLTLALAVEASRSRSMGADAHSLARLGRLRSPTGKRFYPTGEAPLELSAELDEVTSDDGETASPRPRAQ